MLENGTENSHQSVLRNGMELKQIGLILSDASSGKIGESKMLLGDYLARVFYLKRVM